MLKKEKNKIDVSLNNPYRKRVIALDKGQYILKLIHQTEAVFRRPRSLFFTFEIDGKSPQEVKKILGLRDVSAQYGAFVYVGAGDEISGYFVKEIILNITQDIPTLDIVLRTFLPNQNISIEDFQIYNSLIAEEKLFFDYHDFDVSSKNYFKNRNWENICSLLYVDTNRENINELINELEILNSFLSVNHKVLVYFKDRVDESLIDNLVSKLSFLEFLSPSMLGAEIDVSEKYTFDILRKIESYLINIQYCGVFDPLFLEEIQKEGIFFSKISIYDRSRLLEFVFQVSNENQLHIEGTEKGTEKILAQKDNYLLIDDLKKTIKVSERGTIKVSFNIFNKENEVFDTSALVIVSYISKNHNFIMPPDNFGVNPNFGTYKYVVSGPLENPELNELELVISHNDVVAIELTFKSWGKEYIENYLDISSFNVVTDGAKLGVSNADQFVETLSSKDKIILIYTTAPYIGHETLELRPNRLTKEYIKLGYKVIFFAFSRVPEELEYPNEYNGQLLQCHKDELLEYVSLISRKKLEDKIFICSSFPDIFALTAITRLKQFGDWKLSYEIRDDMEEFNRVGYSKWYTTQLEINVARSVDKITTVSPRLASKIKIMSGKFKSREWDKKVQVIQNAAPDTLISKSEYLRSENFFEQKTNSQTVGYIGHLTPAWFDWTLILTAARDFPHINFEIIGHGMPKTLELPSNVVYLGPKDHDSFLKISEKWKVGLIPFITSPLTYGVDPNKIYEYLAANLLVVTADMGSVKECPATYVYEDYQGFKKGLEAALKVQYNHSLLKSISEYVEVSRWSNRAQKMLEFIHKEI